MKDFRQLLKEATGDNVGIMFGRFNPPHRGHKAAWEMASENDSWFVGTNKSTQGKKDPLPYDVKIKAMEAVWPEVASHIVPETNLFTLATKVYNELGEVNLVVYTDEDWLTKTLVKYNGEEGKHGYYNFKSIQQKPTPRLSSATDVRNAVLADDREAFERAAGVPADHLVDGKEYFDLVAEYLLPHHTKESKSDKYNEQDNLKESIMNLNELRKLAGLKLMESEPVNFRPGYAMSDAQKKLAGVGQLLMQDAESERDEKMSNALSALGGALADGSISTTEDLVSFIKNYKVQGTKERDQAMPLTDEQKAVLSDRTSKAIAAYNNGERATGLKPGEKAEDDFVEPELDDDGEIEEARLDEFAWIIPALAGVARAVGPALIRQGPKIMQGLKKVADVAKGAVTSQSAKNAVSATAKVAGKTTSTVAKGVGSAMAKNPASTIGLGASGYLGWKANDTMDKARDAIDNFGTDVTDKMSGAVDDARDAAGKALSSGKQQLGKVFDSAEEYKNELMKMGGQGIQAIKNQSTLNQIAELAAKYAIPFGLLVMAIWGGVKILKWIFEDASEDGLNALIEAENSQVDLSDIRADYGVEEGVFDDMGMEDPDTSFIDRAKSQTNGSDEDLANMLADFEEECKDYYCYGSPDFDAVKKFIDQGNHEAAAEEMTSAMSTRDGDEAPDDAYEMALDMVQNYMAEHGDMGSEMARYESAMSEMRKLAGLAEKVNESGADEPTVGQMSDQELADYIGSSVEEVKADREAALDAAHEKASGHYESQDVAVNEEDLDWNDYFDNDREAGGDDDDAPTWDRSSDEDEFELDSYEPYDDETMGGEVDFDDEHEDEGDSEIASRRDRMRKAKAAGGKYATQEAVEETAKNAMDAAMAELRKLAGL